MHLNIYFKQLFFLTILTLFSGIAFGQYDLDFNIPSVGETNSTDIGARGGLIFGSDGTDNLTIDFFIRNTSSATTWDKSFITGFYILKPWDDDTDVTMSLGTDDITPGNNWNLVESGENAASGSLEGDIPGIPKADHYLYFGGAAANGQTEVNGLGQGEIFGGDYMAEFNFSIDGTGLDLINALAYYGSVGTSLPHLVVRWKGMDLDDSIVPGEDFGNLTSAKGYTYFTTPGTIITVPEPSEIAAMALLGLGFLLWTRNRFFAKKQEQD